MPILHVGSILYSTTTNRAIFPPRFQPLAARRNLVFPLSLVLGARFRSRARFSSRIPFSAPFATPRTVSRPHFVPIQPAHLSTTSQTSLAFLEPVSQPSRHITHLRTPLFCLFWARPAVCQRINVMFWKGEGTQAAPSKLLEKVKVVLGDRGSEIYT